VRCCSSCCRSRCGPCNWSCPSKGGKQQAGAPGRARHKPFQCGAQVEVEEQRAERNAQITADMQQAAVEAARSRSAARCIARRWKAYMQSSQRHSKVAAILCCQVTRAVDSRSAARESS
jgi:hypothetical protein